MIPTKKSLQTMQVEKQARKHNDDIHLHGKHIYTKMHPHNNKKIDDKH
jgi:hypothetical protein